MGSAWVVVVAAVASAVVVLALIYIAFLAIALTLEDPSEQRYQVLLDDTGAVVDVARLEWAGVRRDEDSDDYPNGVIWARSARHAARKARRAARRARRVVR